MRVNQRYNLEREICPMINLNYLESMEGYAICKRSPLSLLLSLSFYTKSTWFLVCEIFITHAMT